ncbi:MAG: hypothetical protein IM600_07645 [Bacteroidetes bacterium]|nr:hypothetical protein [Bacteroidota bacterium]MCA6443283.1 hypothetical protein [Bacteroidota bacterium]
MIGIISNQPANCYDYDESSSERITFAGLGVRAGFGASSVYTYKCLLQDTNVF